MMKLKGMRQTYCVNYQARAGQHGLLVVYDRSGPAICFVFLRFHFLLEAMMRKGKLIISTQCLATYLYQRLLKSNENEKPA